MRMGSNTTTPVRTMPWVPSASDASCRDLEPRQGEPTQTNRDCRNYEGQLGPLGDLLGAFGAI